MNAKFPSDAADLQEQAGDTLDRLTEAAREKVIDPVVKTVRDGASKAAEYGRKAAHSAEEWVDSHPFPTAGIAFLGGVLLGLVLGRQSRW